MHQSIGEYITILHSTIQCVCVSRVGEVNSKIFGNQLIDFRYENLGDSRMLIVSVCVCSACT